VADGAIDSLGAPLSLAGALALDDGLAPVHAASSSRTPAAAAPFQEDLTIIVPLLSVISTLCARPERSGL
jgi:hypothetical protein